MTKRSLRVGWRVPAKEHRHAASACPLITAFAPHGPVVLALDDIIERRRGKPQPTFADTLAAVRRAL